jgi:hypothetical protein
VAAGLITVLLLDLVTVAVNLSRPWGRRLSSVTLHKRVSAHTCESLRM